MDGSDSVQCHTDLVTCCRMPWGPGRGEWYFPDGNMLPSPGGGDVYLKRDPQRVDLRYTGSVDTSGIYHCSIETIATKDSGWEMVYIGLYASGGEWS